MRIANVWNKENGYDSRNCIQTITRVKQDRDGRPTADIKRDPLSMFLCVDLADALKLSVFQFRKGGHAVTRRRI
jgi:hypothetical protein